MPCGVGIALQEVILAQYAAAWPLMVHARASFSALYAYQHYVFAAVPRVAMYGIPGVKYTLR